MFSVTDILAIEEINTNAIHLFREGLFWKACQHSAYLFGLDTGKNYKLTKKYFKVADTEMISLGFPDNRLKETFGLERVHLMEPNHLLVETNAVWNEQAYNDWFTACPLTLKPEQGEASNPSSSTGISAAHKVATPVAGDVHGLLRKLQEFRVDQSTPMDCMMFVISLQKDLNNTSYGTI